MLSHLRRRGVRFSTLTHAAGISSTGDPALDAHLPFDEPYVIPSSTAVLIELTKAEGGRVVAIGTTVVRALEHAARRDGRVAAGPGVATGRLGRDTRLRVVDAIVSGVHETDTSHYELLRAFQRDDVLTRATVEAEAKDYLAHEFGDAVLIVRSGSGGTLVADEWQVASEMRQVARRWGMQSGSSGLIGNVERTTRSEQGRVRARRPHGSEGSQVRRGMRRSLPGT